MSTRSGKRIHGSIDSPIEETERILGSDRKTRSKRQNENEEVTVKKKHNYVSYPGNGDVESIDMDTHDKPRRRTRRDTLKEHNVDLPMAMNVDFNSDKNKSVRKSRRGQKLIEEGESAVDKENVERPMESKTKPVANGKKKSKKKKNHKKASAEAADMQCLDDGVIIKKKGKKKKKSSSVTNEQDVEQAHTNVNRSNMSVDSFHSAAGSLVNGRETENDDQTNLAVTFIGHEDEENVINMFHKAGEALNTTVSEITKKKIKSSINNTTFDKSQDTPGDLNTTVGSGPTSRRTSSIKNSTFDKAENIFELNYRNKAGVENLNTTYDKTNVSGSHASAYIGNNNKVKIHSTSNSSGLKEAENQTEDPTDILNNMVDEIIGKKRKSSIKNSTFDISEAENANATFDKNDTDPEHSIFNKDLSRSRRPSLKNMIQNDSMKNLITNVERKSNRFSKTKPLDSTFDKDCYIDMNTPVDHKNKGGGKTESGSTKSSLISLDASLEGFANVTFDKSDDHSRISITSDESKTENIMNNTPVLIESSIDESRISEHNNKSPDQSEVQAPSTPLKREGTFTKDGSDIAMSPCSKVTPERTPLKREGTFTKDGSDIAMSPSSKFTPERTSVKRKSLPCTPFPFSKSSQKEKSMLNVTRSIEKSLRQSSEADVGPRQTKVMFCSPASSLVAATQIKGRVIKSNLKGSNKSFVFDDSALSPARLAGRKRSRTLGAPDPRAKRSRPAPDRPRTVSAAAKLPDPSTPAERGDARVARTRLPNFAALHQKQFAKMESLDECQLRKARRAKQLLTPTGCVDMLERISPKGTPPKTEPVAKEPAAKQQTPTKPKLPTLASLNPGYSRFGFKLLSAVNPFSVPAKRPEARPTERRVDAGQARGALPSLAGATAGRRAAAKQAVMREKSFTEIRDVKRKENRTIIKGVRTNRRFELQMQLRNINA